MIGFFRSSEEPHPIPALSCEVCKRPIMRHDLAMVLRFDAERDTQVPYNPMMREVEMHVGLPGIVVHKGDCDTRLRRKYGSRVTANLPLLEALAAALHNAGVKDVPDGWFSAYGREDIARLVPAVPPSLRTSFLDENGELWKATEVDEATRRVRLEAYLNRRTETVDMAFDEFHERFTVLQDI